MLIDFAQVSLAQSDAMAVEKIEDLNSDLSAVGDAVAKLRGDKRAAFRLSRHFGDDGRHLAYARPQEEMIVRHFVDPPHPSSQLEQSPDIAFLPPRCLSDVAHSRRTKPRCAAQQRRDHAPGDLV